MGWEKTTHLEVIGEHKDDEEWNGKVYDKDGNIDVKFVNGK